MNIEAIIKNKNTFSMYVEKEAHKSKTTLFDMLLVICEKHNIEFDSIQKMISQSLYDKLHKEALELKLLKEKPHFTNINNFF